MLRARASRSWHRAIHNHPKEHVMSHDSQMVSLGFTKKRFPSGSHICQIFEADDERLDSLLKFILSGLVAGERTACFTEKLDDARLSRFLADSGLQHDHCVASGAFSRSATRAVYFKDDRFDPDRMIGLLQKFHEDSVASGFPAARVIGEMTADIQHISGGSRLTEYESRVSMLLRTHPLTAVCQYDATTFDGATTCRFSKSIH